MNYNEIDWDKIPDVMSKEQFRIICHISKRTARYLLESKKVPCTILPKSTHRYKIKKSDVIDYLKNRDENPEFYRKPLCTTVRNYSSKALIPTDADMAEFYAEALTDCPDVMTAKHIAEITGYQQSTVNKWHHRGLLKGFIKSRELHIPKIYLIEFFNSQYFRNIPQKNLWHKRMEQKYIEYCI